MAKLKHAKPRDPITAAVVNDLGAWADRVQGEIEAEHDKQGRHRDLRFPKASIWITRPDRPNHIHPSSVIGTERVQVGPQILYQVVGIDSNAGSLTGRLNFLQGIPGAVAVLNSSFSQAYNVAISRERRVWIQGNFVSFVIPWREETAYPVGVVLYA